MAFSHANPLEDPVRLPSERSFGLLFAAVFAGFAGWAWYAGRPVLAGALVVAAAALVAVAFTIPRLLAWPNRLWFRLGMALNAVVSPIVLFVMFAVMFVPVALVMRIAGRGISSSPSSAGRSRPTWS